MRPKFTRYLRWRLAESGLIPRSAVGKLFLYFLVAALISYVGRELGNSISAGAGNWFNIPLIFSYAVVAPLGVFLAFRWVRNRVLWRLRNRLMVTYVFIGVVPVLLILLMAGIAIFLFAGQFATYLATADLQAEARSLAAANSAVANELAQKMRLVSRGAAPELLGVAQLGEAFSDAEVNAWQRGRPILLQQEKKEPSFAEPAWLEKQRTEGETQKLRFQGIVADEGGLYLRAAVVLPGEAHLTVVSSVPLNAARLARLGDSVGQITIYGDSNVEISNTGGVRVTQRSSRPQAARDGAALQAEETSTAVRTVSGGTVPPTGGRFDYDVRFGAPVTLMDWKTGKPVNVLMGVGTTTSALYQRLFLRIGTWANTWFNILAGVAIFFAVIELVALLIGIGLTRTVTRSVHKLYEATQRVNRGDFRHRITVKSNDQLATLEKSFNSMVENLELLIAEQKEKERLQSELAIAQEVQAQLFPREIKQLETFELHGVCRPARIVSGDYYDFIPLGRDQLGIAVGDISGKGISAALLMATLHSAVRAFEFGRMPHVAGQLVSAASVVRPAGTTKLQDIAWRAASDGHVSTAEVMSLLNHHLYASTPLEKYATLFLGTFDSPTRQMTYTNAGHLPPLIIAGDGSVRRLDEGGLVIGLFDDLSFEERTIQLHPGDIFVAYSDGITEPENEFGEFGEQRLLELVRDYRNLPLARITDHVIEAVQAWIGGAEQPDDVTLVLARAH
jgi:sigma-B regulation protein RsbU (phosphoserine phosphatase)